MSIGWTVAIVIAGIMSGGGMAFCFLALVVSSRQAEERAKREEAERIRRVNHKSAIDDKLVRLRRAERETQIARNITREIFVAFEEMHAVLVKQDPDRWSERRAAAIRKKLEGSPNETKS